ICLMLTPLVLAMCEAAALPAVPFLLALAFSSNAGSVATLTGNPQNMLIGTLSGIHYARFAALLIVPALLALGTVLIVLRIFFRRELQPRAAVDVDLPAPLLDRPRAIVCLIALGVVLVGFLLGYSLAWTAMTGAALLLIFLHEPPKLIFAR